MAAASVSTDKTNSLAATTSAGVATPTAPRVTNAAVFSAERFQIVSAWPLSSRRSAIAEPIRPVPSTPIFMVRP